MNDQGEIKKYTAEEIRAGKHKKDGFTIQMTGAEVEVLSDLEPADRALAMRNWQDKAAAMKFNSNIEKYKVKMAFFEGFVVGRLSE